MATIKNISSTGIYIEELFLQCLHCNTQFGEEDCLPTVLSCLHTLCSSCLPNLMKDNILQCPKCGHKTCLITTGRIHKENGHHQKHIKYWYLKKDTFNFSHWQLKILTASKNWHWQMIITMKINKNKPSTPSPTRPPLLYQIILWCYIFIYILTVQNDRKE
jgi:hypothetical protein